MAEKKLFTKIVLRHDVLSNWNSSDKVLLNGEAALALRDDGSYEIRIGDGSKKWSELSATGFGHTEYIAKSSFADLSTVISAQNGAIGVVTETIAGDKVSKTAYSFNATEKRWEALDGNYSAENVYFANDITCAGSYTQVGNISKDLTATATITAAGKSVKDVFQNIFTKELQPSITAHPAWSFDGNSTITAEVGTTYYPAGATATFSNKGSYTYGPDTGITVPVNNAVVKRTTTGHVAELSNTAALTAGSSDASKVKLDASTTSVTYTKTATSYSYEAYMYHPEGVSAVTNLGTVTSTKIAANDWSNNTAASASKKTCTKTYTGYYPCYYGKYDSKKFANPGALTSADIVSYSGAAVTAVNGFSKTVNTNERPADQTTYTTYVGQQWFWIAPKGKITSVYARQNSPAAPLGTVVGPYEVTLPTANGYGDVVYEVWYVNNDNAASNGYAWKLNGTF